MATKIAEIDLNKSLKSPTNNDNNRARIERCLWLNGPCDTQTLMEYTGLTEGKVRVALNGLSRQGRAHCEQGKLKNILWYHGPRKIVSTATPRLGIPRETYRPEPWPVEYSRPGALDHLKCGSLRDGEVVPYRAPMAGCVGALADKRPLFKD